MCPSLFAVYSTRSGFMVSHGYLRNSGSQKVRSQQTSQLHNCTDPAQDMGSKSGAIPASLHSKDEIAV